MTTRLVAFALFLLCAYMARASVDALGESCVILPESQGQNAVSQCSRVSPDRVTAFWTPSIEQVLEFERRLPALLKKSGHKIQLSQSRRQYIGMVSRGRRLIYLNAIPANEPDSVFETDWRSTAFTVCDGGDGFWGVAFDPATHKFHYLGFNGVA